MADEGIFRFPEDIERGPTSYQEMKFIVLWEAECQTPFWEVFWEAPFVTKDPEEQVSLGERVLRELRGEGLIEAVRPAFAEPEDQAILSDVEFEEAVGDLTLRDPEACEGRAVFIRPSDAGERWLAEYRTELGWA